MSDQPDNRPTIDPAAARIEFVEIPTKARLDDFDCAIIPIEGVVWSAPSDYVFQVVVPRQG
jgi:hypothetical protein